MLSSNSSADSIGSLVNYSSELSESDANILIISNCDDETICISINIEELQVEGALILESTDTTGITPANVPVTKLSSEE